jgi:hypothetical protein
MIKLQGLGWSEITHVITYTLGLQNMEIGDLLAHGILVENITCLCGIHTSYYA